MKVLELADFYSNYGSNFIPTLEYLEKKLNQNGHKVFFIFSKRNLSEKFFEWEKPFEKKHRTALFDFTSRNFVRDVVEFIKKNDIDVVHAHFCASFLLSQIKKKTKGKVAFYQHIHSCPFNNKKTIRAYFKRFRNIFILDKNIKKICVSKSIVPMTKFVFPLQTVIYCTNAIDFSRLEIEPRASINKNSILLFGYNYYIKGVDLALKAITNLRHKTGLDIQLDIVMSDHMESNIEIIKKNYGEIPDGITLLEPMSDVSKLYNNHYVFLNSSRSEGLSFANIEAYYSNCLCVFSDISQNKEAGLPNVSYFRAGDSDDLERALSSVLLNDVQMNNDIDYVKRTFSLERWSDEMMQILKPIGN